MDPLSVTAACVGLLNGILGLSKQISSFVIGTRDAHKDMQAFSKELVSLQLCLESPKEERIVNQFPDRLKQSLLVIIRSCSDIVEQMSGLLERHSSVNLGRRMQWSMFSRDEAEKLRNNLEAHKSAIESKYSSKPVPGQPATLEFRRPKAMFWSPTTMADLATSLTSLSPSILGFQTQILGTDRN